MTVSEHDKILRDPCYPENFEFKLQTAKMREEWLQLEGL
jgi:hypothetical protein